jgi:hypothetical protein
MIIEQIRYFASEGAENQILEVRREVSRLRSLVGAPGGHILIADPPPEDGPAIIWQCAYEDESEMAHAEATITGNADYSAARERLGGLVTRIELEIYASDEDDGTGPATPAGS